MNNPYDLYTLYGGDKRIVLGKASTATRVVALLIDFFIIIKLVFPPLLILIFPYVDAVIPRLQPAIERLFLLAFPIFTVMLVFVFKDIVKGQSLGKWIMKIAVRDCVDTAKTPSIGKLILRNLPIFIWPIELLFLSGSGKKLKIGDRLAGTNVYRVPVKSKATLVIIIMILSFVIMVFGIIIVLEASRAFATPNPY